MARAVQRDHLNDGDAIANLGWRQGSILSPNWRSSPASALRERARRPSRPVEPLGTDEITLADIEPYQQFDADWVNFEDETPTTPTTADMTT